MHRADALSDEQLAGQSLMVGFEGQNLDRGLRTLIREMHVGGIVLFKRNVSSPHGLAALCEKAQSFSAHQGNPSLCIAIDQEGGAVARLGPPFTVFPGNRAIGRAGSEEAARDFGITAGRELRSTGITMNLAPVLDVTPKELRAGVMARRVFGNDPQMTARLGTKVIAALQETGVAATAKHFPGLGRTRVDPHQELPAIDAEAGLLQETDLVPFGAAIKMGVDAIMLSHAVYRKLDSQWPASLSWVIAKDLLRKAMGFSGVIMTDDLDMGAVSKHFGAQTWVERICKADIEMVLVCRNRARMDEIYQSLLRAIRDSREVRRGRILCVQRILDMKGRYPFRQL
jgi:beta-N-acetylhexosaminidase